jgi:hypothetical protein
LEQGRRFSSLIIEIAKVAKTAGFLLKEPELLFRITHYYKPESILEVGLHWTGCFCLSLEIKAKSPHRNCAETAKITKTN